MNIIQMQFVKKFLKAVIPKSAWGRIAHRDEYFRIISIRRALRYQGLLGLYNQLNSIIPDISDQYSGFKVDSEYFKTKVRAEHAFQISLVQKALELLGLENGCPLRIVDIGDSCGTHLQYLKRLYKNVIPLSINLDPEAVKKIKEKGIEAVCGRAEDVYMYFKKADLCLSFEMLEHLSDPISFLYKLSDKVECKAFVLSVPYLAKSGVGLRHIRNNQKGNVCAEDVHIFELSPSDWKLIFQHAGWSILYEKTYLQYPQRDIFSFMKRHWKKIDYEGFYGAILLKDSSWSNLYKDWYI